MRTPLFVAAWVAAVAAVAASQDKRQDDPRVLVVTGCVERSWLKVVTTDPNDTHVDKFHLRGSKDLLKTLTKDLNGHKVEVTGILDDPGRTMGTGQTKQIGKKTKVYVGQREILDHPPIRDPSIDVRSFKDLSDKCR